MNAFASTDLGDEFAAYLPFPTRISPHFEDALRHVLENPGSLVRPRIVFRMAVAYGMNLENAKQLAIALEYFHTASLLFDDLPCMDNAAERRGASCVHIEYGEASAILSALALINRAYGLTWQSIQSSSHDAQQRAITYIEQRLGLAGVLDGQSLDLHYSELPHDYQTTQRIAIGKTVSLIRLALVLPAILGGAAQREINQLERIAMYWGLSYQIMDDLKDLLRSANQTGKTVARDIVLDRPNAAMVLGVPQAVDRLNRLIKLGDRTLRRLVASRPSLAFLGKLRSDLQSDVTLICNESNEIAMLCQS